MRFSGNFCKFRTSDALFFPFQSVGLRTVVRIMSSFESFQGNEHLVHALRLALRDGRIPHTLLFSGQDGVGKRTLALMLAKALNCLRAEGDFCDSCASCRKIDGGTQPDVEYIGVLEDKHFLSIDQIRKARQDVFYQPFEGRFRIFIIDEADRMKDEAANSILKMLEEPPPSTKLILLTTKFHALLPTIRSRCQVFMFSPLPLSVVRTFLSGHTSGPVPELELRARLAQGSLGRALTFDVEQFREMRTAVFEMIQAAATLPLPETIFALADSIGKDKEQFEESLNIFYVLLHDLFYLVHRASEDWITNVDLIPALRDLAERIPGRWIHDAIARLDAITAGLRININRPIALEDFALSLSAASR